MFRNKFGEPKPADFDELQEAIDELNLNPVQCMVTVSDNSGDNDPYNGWTADIIGEDDVSLETAAWSSKDDLLKDLEAAGFEGVEVI